jgi:hypothetical protein
MLRRGKQCRRRRRILADPDQLREISSRYIFDPMSLSYFIYSRISFSFVQFVCGSPISGLVVLFELRNSGNRLALI